MLVETRYLCNPVKSPDSVFSALDNKLIHLSGKLSTSGPVTDSLYGVTGAHTHPVMHYSVVFIPVIKWPSGNFVRLKRTVEMYQWIEETETRLAETSAHSTPYHCIAETPS